MLASRGPEPTRRRYLGPAVIAVLLALSLLNLNAGMKRAGELNLVDRIVMRLSAPAQQAMTWGIESVAGAWNEYVYLVGLREENRQLEAELAELRARAARLEEEEYENRRLRRLLGMKEDARILEQRGARVIAVGASPYFRTVRIEAGTEDGVEPDMAVVGAGGVVGRVVSASGTYADVLLLADPNSAVDVIVQRSRARGIVKGLGEVDSYGCRIDYLERTEDVKVGDVLVTSGLGGIFPPGLRVGTVAEVSRPEYGLYQAATLEPAVDFTRLEEVSVVLEQRIDDDEVGGLAAP